MLGLSLWEGRLPGQKTIENEDKAAMGSYRPESNFGTSDTVSARDEGEIFGFPEADKNSGKAPRAEPGAVGSW